MTLSVGFGTDRPLAIYEDPAHPPGIVMTQAEDSEISSDADVNSRGLQQRL